MVQTAFAAIDPAKVSSTIASVTTTFESYFDVLLASLLPVLIGLGVLVALWYLGKRIVAAFS